MKKHLSTAWFTAVVIAAAFAATVQPAVAQTAAQTAGLPDLPPAVIPVDNEAAPQVHAYAPVPAALARGVVIVQYRTENFRVFPVFGENAVDVSPRVGHLHVTVDDGPGTWAHTSVDPIIVVGLKPGPHRMLLELADPSHRILAARTVNFVVPEKKAAAAGAATQAHSGH